MGLTDKLVSFGKSFLPGKKTAVAIGAGAIVVSSPANISDVPDKPAEGPLVKLEPESNPYLFSSLQYPLDGLGSRYPHYITFYMNAKDKTKYKEQFAGLTPNREQELQTDSKRARDLTTIQVPFIGKYINFARQTTRTAQTIRLYMPDTMHWTFLNNWKDVALSDALPLAKTTELGASIMDRVKAGLNGGESLSSLSSSLGAEMTAMALENLGPKFGVDRDLALRSFGYAINPNIDVIYGAPGLRELTFDFMFAPRSTAESNQVLSIIRAFKFHAAPESSPDSGAGRYWMPPTEFDLEFSTLTLGRVATCVLKAIDVDYAPNGFAVYSEELRDHDMPSTIRLQLQFQEIEFITKEKVGLGY